MASVLLLESDSELREAIVDGLEACGFAVRAFSVASDAWRSAEAAPADLVVCSFLIRRDEAYVPDGALVLINKLRVAGLSPERAWMGRVPIIVTQCGPSRYSSADPKRLLAHLGVGAFMERPLDVRKLAGRAASMVGRVHAHASAAIAAE